MSTNEYSANLPKWVKRLGAIAVEANRVCHFSQRRLDSSKHVTAMEGAVPRA